MFITDRERQGALQAVRQSARLGRTADGTQQFDPVPLELFWQLPDDCGEESSFGSAGAGSYAGIGARSASDHVGCEGTGAHAVGAFAVIRKDVCEQGGGQIVRSGSV